jgi:Flp pilus assembly protein TadG
MLGNHRNHGTASRRRGAAAAEFAVLLPFLAFLFVATVDFARVFFHTITVTNCARNGALYLSDPFLAAKSPYADFKEAAKADASSLDPALNDDDITSATGTDGDGHEFVEVTVTYRFNTLVDIAGVANPIELTRTVQMRKTPKDPDNS